MTAGLSEAATSSGGRLAWPGEPARAASTASASLAGSTGEALDRLAATLEGGMADVLRALAHALLYRYLDEDRTSRLEIGPDGAFTAFTRSTTGGTRFRTLAGAADERPPGTSHAVDSANLLVCPEGPGDHELDPRIVRIWLCRKLWRVHVVGEAPPTALERLAAHAARLLSHAAAAPDTPLDDLDLLNSDDHERFAEFSGPRLEATGPDTIDRLFLAQARRTPDPLAASCAEERLTYRSLEEQSAALARALHATGIGSGDIVAVSLPRSCRLLVAVLAVLRSGAAAMMIDPDQPRARQSRMLRLSGVRSALGSGPVPEPIEEAGLAWMDIAAARDSPACDLPEISPEDAAYVIFTSGSTGEPKAVAVSHAAMANRMRWLSAAYGLGEPDVSLVRTALSFDPSWCEMLRLLGVGGRAHFLPHGQERDPACVVDAIESERVTIIDLVPTPLEALLEHCRAFGQSGRLHSLRWVLAGAEELPGRLIGSFRRLLGSAGTRLINGWGATETTVDATWQDCTELTADSPAPLGRPIGNCDAHILSRSGRLLPLGMTGELAISGACLAIGYLNPDPDRQPFRALPALGGRRAYLSGDRARWSSDGVLHFVSRDLGILKIRGVRVTPREILDHLETCPEVREAFLHKHRTGDQREEVLLYVVPRTPGLRAEQVQAFLDDRLPATMTPDRCLVLPEFPRSASEKIDFGRLPLPSGIAADAPSEVSSDPLASWVQRTCASLLGRPLGPTDDFFGAGGHSLAAVRLIARVADDLGRAVSVRDVYKAPTPVELASRIAAAPGVASQPVSGDQSMRASHAQRRLWLLSRDPRGSLAYHVPLNLPLVESWDRRLLQTAIDHLVKRHEILRTRFLMTRQGLLQIVDPFEPGMVRAEMVELAPGEPAESCLKRLHGRPFDLATGPLLRLGLLRSHSGGADVLFVTQHHIITDAWSMALLLDELTNAYRAARDRKEVGDLPLRLQHRDVAAWHARWLEGPNGRSARAYWRECLARRPPPLQLPTDLPRTADRPRHGGVLHRFLPPALCRSILALAGTAGASPFMAFLAAVSVLLSRWSGQTEFVLGAPFAGRTRREFENQLGCFVNSLPLRASLVQGDDFLDVLRRVRETCLDALEHQLCPFDVIVEDFAAQNGGEIAPLFEVMVVVQNAPGARSMEALPDLTTVETELEASKLDLVFTFTERDRQWRLRLDFDASLFAPESIERLSDQFCGMLEVLAQAPDMPIRELSAPATLPAPAQEAQTRGSLHASFEAWARREPERIALVCGNRRVSYGELDRGATALASRLEQRTPQRRGLVAIYLKRSERVVEAQLAVLKAGHAFLTLNPEDPAERLEWLLADSEAIALIESAAHPLAARLPDRCVRVPVDPRGISRPAADLRLASPAGPGDDAYVIYTSGSTGRPKGVVVTHGAACSLIEAAQSVVPIHAAESWSIFHAFSFDFSIWETFVPLSRGGRAVLACDAVRRDPAAFARLIADQSVTVLSQVPTAFEHVGPELARRQPARLQWVVFGGEPVNLALVRQLMPQMPRVTFLNGYGITETTVFSSFKELTVASVAQNIGRPLGNQHIWIMDETLRPVLPGAVGEICIGGAAVARGYLNAPNLSARSFVHLPGQPSARIYRSGDFGRWNASGELLYLGRRDRQVKRRGHRIELDEIRAVALSVPRVEECAVVAYDDPQGEPEIVAFVAAPDDALAEVRAQLSRLLPRYMAPSRIVVVERLPQLENGKTDMAALERAASADLSSTPEPPPESGGGAVGIILDAMRRAIGVPSLGPDDDFFAAGGHSLAALRVLAEAEAALGMRLELEALFDQPNARALARLVPADVADTPADPASSGGPSTSPASPVQAGLWAIEHFRGEGLSSATVERRDLDGQIDPDLCARAFAAVFERFDIFRTTFALESGALMQRVDAEGATGATFRTVGAETGQTPEQQVANVIRAEAMLPFDLSKGPLVRMTLVLGEATRVLICAAHHSVWDGASLDLTLAGWQQAYEALASGAAPPQRVDREQYAAFLGRQQERLKSPAGQAALAFWRDRCDGGGRIGHLVPAAAAAESYVGVSHSFVLDGSQVDRLRALCTAGGATLFVGLQALVRGWLWLRWAASEVAIGSPVMTRHGVDVSGTPGPFLNHVILRSGVSGADSLRQVVARAAEEVRLSLRHALVPPELAAAPGAGRLFDVGLTLQSLDGKRPSPERAGDGGRVFGIHTPLWLDITPVDSALHCDLVANLDYFSPAAAHDLTEDAQRCFALLIVAADEPLALVSQRRNPGVRLRLDVD